MARRTAKSGSPKAKDEPKNRKSSVELHDRPEGKSIADGARVLREINGGQQQRARVEPQHQAGETRQDPQEFDQVVRSKTGEFLCIFTLARAGLVGLNKLALRLNSLKNDGLIRDWHTEGWHDRKTQLRAIVRFDTEADALSAISKVGR
jgi:hypothetical protein